LDGAYALCLPSNVKTRLYYQRITELLDELTEGESELAVRCRTDSSFYDFIIETTEALAEFYEQMEGDILDIFESKLRGWVRDTSAAYIGIAGELFVADWLRRHNIPHHFVQETTHKTPDIELDLKYQTAYLEIKTLKESFYDWFAQRILDEIESFLPDRGISIEDLELEEGKEEVLVDKAVQKIKDWSKAPYSPIQYKGEEGQFSFLLPTGKGCWYWPESIDKKRNKEDSIPWVQSRLKKLLDDNIEKFKNYKPTFLTWFIPQDFALSENISDHIGQVLEQFGDDFVDVAGVVLLDSVSGWLLIENPSYKEYQQLKDSGLFNVISTLQDQ
jgi:hypothetical protein